MPETTADAGPAYAVFERFRQALDPAFKAEDFVETIIPGLVEFVDIEAAQDPSLADRFESYLEQWLRIDATPIPDDEAPAPAPEAEEEEEAPPPPPEAKKQKQKKAADEAAPAKKKKTPEEGESWLGLTVRHRPKGVKADVVGRVTAEKDTKVTFAVEGSGDLWKNVEKSLCKVVDAPEGVKQADGPPLVELAVPAWALALIEEHLGQADPVAGVDEGDLLLGMGFTRKLGRKAEMRRVVVYLVNAMSPSEGYQGSPCFVEVHVLPPGEKDPSNAECSHEPIVGDFGGPYRIEAGGKAYDLQFAEGELDEGFGDTCKDLRPEAPAAGR
jgi:hypothetical protein